MEFGILIPGIPLPENLKRNAALENIFDLSFDIHINLGVRVSNRKTLRESGSEPAPIQDLNLENQV